MTVLQDWDRSKFCLAPVWMTNHANFKTHLVFCLLQVIDNSFQTIFRQIEPCSLYSFVKDSVLFCWNEKLHKMTDHKSGTVIISCSSAWSPLCGAEEMYWLVLSAVYRKAKNESWDWEENSPASAACHAYGQERGISPTALQVSITLLCMDVRGSFLLT